MQFFKFCLLTGALLLAFGSLTARIEAQEVKHPDMETFITESGDEIIVIAGTQTPINPDLYDVKEEEGPKGPILVVYYRPTGEMVTLFGKTTIKGKVEGPGVTLFPQRVPPQIEKVIGQKSYDRDIKRRYLELIYFDKFDLMNPDKINLGEINEILKRRRN